MSHTYPAKLDNISEQFAHLSPVKQALLAIQTLQSKIGAMVRERCEPIAIIGLGCRFPGGANDPASFWQLLRDGVDAVTEMPADRWDTHAYYDPDPDALGKMYTRYGSFLDQGQAIYFEPDFFGLSPRQAMSMDPQQRLLLEVSWEALEYAGQAPDKLPTRTGVFVGIGQNDYSQLPHLNPHDYTQLGPYDGSGNLFCFASGRLSYILGLQGPNMAIDTACSSSLVALHLACQSLRAGECELALAGGVHLILSPKSTIGLSRMRALSPDGRCKTFSAQADGYGRGEGCGMVLLKRLSDAQANGDNILAVIRGSAVNHDGPSSGLTVPNKQAQEVLIGQALQAAQIEPAEVSYVEAHGTGTSLGDPLEVRALASVVGASQSRTTPLMIGSVKTNIGHLEAAAGIASLIKVVLSLQHGEIPPHLHCQELNPHLNWDELPVSVPTERMAWEGEARVAGISSFGLSGTNVHLLLTEAPLPASAPPQAPPQLWEGDAGEASAQLLMLSAKTEEALEALIGRYIEHFERLSHGEASPLDVPDAQLHWRNTCFTSHVGRSHFKHRLAVVAESLDEARLLLLQFKSGEQAADVFRGLEQGHDDNQTDPPPKACPDEARVSGGKEGDERRDKLKNLAQRYVRGAEIKRSELYPQGMPYQRVVLPTYPWQRERYWPEPSGAPSLLAKPSQRLFRGTPDWGGASQKGAYFKKISSPLLKTTLFESQLSTDALPFLLDHQIYDAIVVPAAFYLSLLVHLAGQEQETAHLEQLLFRQALVLQAGEERTLQVSYEKQAERDAFQLITFGESDESVWTTHVKGKRAAPVRTPQRGEPLGRLDLQAVQARCPEKFVGGDINLTLQERKIQLGPSFQWLSEIWRGVGEVLGKMHSPEGLFEHFTLHPGLLDSCFQLLVALDMASPEGDESKTLIPVSIERFDFRKPPPSGATFWCHARLRPTSDGRLIADIQLTDSLTDANLIVDMVGVEFMQIERSRLYLRSASVVGLPTSGMLYQIAWHPVKQALPTPVLMEEGNEDEEAGRWLIFADQGEIGHNVAVLLAERGARSVLVVPGTSYMKLQQKQEEFGESSATSVESLSRAVPTEQYQLNPANPQHFERLLQETLSTGAYRGVIHLWALDGTDTDAQSERFLAQAAGCGSALHLLQAMSQAGISPQLWLVTQGAQPLNERVVQPEQAPLWGLGGVIALEHPEFRCVRVDFGSHDQHDLAQLLFQEIWQPDGENQVAYTYAKRAESGGQGERYVARLVQAKRGNQSTLTIQEDACYLITGGLGALGLQAARYLVKEGARYLVLTSRRGISSPEQAQAVQALEEAGAVVEVVKADVSKPGDMESLLAKHALTKEPIKHALRGVIHAAGLLDDGVLMQQSLARFEKVMAPKIQGAWHLHTLTQDMPLDFFVMFSSAASLLGSPGQGNYAAANAFMDGLAHYRASKGLPALSLNWGAWGKGGMSTELAEHHQRRVAGQGMQPIEPEQGWRIFHELLNEELASPQVGVLNMNWAQFRLQFAGMGEPPLFSELALESYVEDAKQTPPHSATLTRQELIEAAPDEREALLIAYLRELVARALGLRVARLDSEQPLNMMGIDSLTALELRNQIKSDLDLDVSVVKLLEGLNVLMLATYLNQQLMAQASTSDTAVARSANQSPENLLDLMEDAQHAEELFAELDELGEEDIDALLMAMSDEM